MAQPSQKKWTIPDSIKNHVFLKSLAESDMINLDVSYLDGNKKGILILSQNRKAGALFSFTPENFEIVRRIYKSETISGKFTFDLLDPAIKMLLGRRAVRLALNDIKSLDEYYVEESPFWPVKMPHNPLIFSWKERGDLERFAPKLEQPANDDTDVEWHQTHAPENIAYCNHCSKPFKFKKPSKMYCTEKCRVQAWIQRRREKNLLKKQNRPIKRCLVCDGILTGSQKWYCGNSCAKRDYRKKIKLGLSAQHKTFEAQRGPSRDSHE